MDIQEKINKLRTSKSTFQDENGSTFQVSPEGSLGIMALGYKGIMAWKNAVKNKKV